MSDDPLKDLNARQRRFVQFVADGMPAGQAYTRAGYFSKGAAADTGASRMLRNVQVAAAVDALRAQANEDCRWKRKRAMDYLVDILETPIAQVSPNHPLCQEFQAATARSGAKIKMPGKIDAIRELARMCGWYEPERHVGEITVVIGGDADAHD